MGLMVYGGGLGWRQKKRWKPFLGRMNYFRERAGERKWNKKKKGGRQQARGALHDFKLTIIVGCDMYYVSWGCESWAHFHGDEGNSPLSQFEHVQLAWAPHLRANYNSFSFKSLPQLSEASPTMRSLLLGSLDIQLTECSSHFLPLPLQCKIRH